MTLTRHIGALALSATIAITGAAPAFADTRSYAHVHQDQPQTGFPGGLTGQQAAGGLLALLLLGLAVKEARDDDDDDDVVEHRPRQDRGHRPRYGQGNGGRDLVTILPRRDEDRAEARRTLPRECLERFRTERGARNLFMRQCLERNYNFASRLPAACEMRVLDDGQIRSGFRRRCLERSGYTVARH